MNYISMFSGIEAASVAWTPLGWRAIAVSEVDKFPSAVLAYHFPDVPNVGDMSTHDWSRYRGQCDIVVGGPPCQAFSVAGLGRSLDDARGNLSLSFARAIHAIGPTWAVVENVPGWLSTKDNAFGCMLAALVGADDALCSPLERGRWPSAGMVAGPLARAAWRVLDAQYFGLAQRRQRVFLVVGFGDGCDPAAVLFERESLSGNPAPRREAGPRSTCGTLGGTSPGGGWRLGADEAAAGQLIPQAYGGNNTSGPVDVATALSAHAGPHGRQDFASETFIAHTLRAEGFDASEDGTGRGIPLVPVAFNPQAGGKQTSLGYDPSRDTTGTLEANQIPAVAFGENVRGDIRTMDIAAALQTQGGKPGQGYPATLPGSSVRRLTPRECERLQGFPDNWTAVPYRNKPAADGPRYKALGNSMAVTVMAWLGMRIEMVSAILAERRAA